MREIKFRAWNKDKNIMVYSNEDDSCDWRDGVEASVVDLVNFKLEEGQYSEYVWMQYTGLKDKNGVEIYEGDIMVLDGKNRIFNYVVKYDKNSFILDGELSTFDKSAYFEEREVIGNIYENQELLET